MITVQRSLATFVVMILFGGQFARAEPRLPVPSEQDQEAASKLVAEVYRHEYEGAKDQAARIKLALKLLQDGKATADNPAARFVLLRIARDIALRESSLDVAFSAIEASCKDFELDEVELKDTALRSLYKKPISDADRRRQTLTAAVELAGQWSTIDRYDRAEALLQVAIEASKKQKDVTATKQLQNQLKEVGSVREAFDASRESFAKLQAQPADSQANLVTGKFLCYFKNDWARGIPMLALSTDESLSALAKAELQEKPDAHAIADKWWAVAEKAEGITKRHIQSHAATWYQRALPELAGLSKAKVEQRLKGLGVDAAMVMPMDAAVAVPQRDPMKPISITTEKVSTIDGFAMGSSITSIVYSPNGDLIAATDRNSVKVWSVSQSAEVARLTGAGDRIHSLAFSPDGKQIAGGCWDKTIRVWDVADFRLKTTIEGADGVVANVAYSPDNSLIASSDGGLSATLWTPGGRRIQRLQRAKAFAFSPTEKTIAIFEDGAVSICKIPGGQQVFSLTDLGKDARRAAYSPDGRNLAVLCVRDNPRLEVLDLEKRVVKLSLALSGSVSTMAYSPDGCLLATGDSNALTIWNARTGQELHQIKVRHSVSSVAFSPKSDAFALSGRSEVQIWRVEDKEP